MQNIQIPEKFLPEKTGERTRGVRHNRAFESVTMTPDGVRLFAGTETALLQDDEPTGAERGTRARIIEYSIGDGSIRPEHEYVYEVEPVSKPENFASGSGDNGLVELLAMSRDKILSLERSFFVESAQSAERRTHQAIRIFHISLKEATDVSAVHSLQQAPEITAVKKHLVLDLADVIGQLSPEFPRLDNFEGMCLGPTLPDGSRTLILASDNNFLARQRTAFFVFKLVE
jgi:3-phytase/alkaline phosphatase D